MQQDMNVRKVVEARSHSGGDVGSKDAKFDLSVEVVEVGSVLT